MQSVLEQSFLHALGIGAPPTFAVVAPDAPSLPDDDPALWVEIALDRLADDLTAALDELSVTEKRIREGERHVADRETQKQPVPTTWKLRMTNLTTRRDALHTQIVDLRTNAAEMTVTLDTRLNDQWPWLWAAQSNDAVQSLFGEREDAWLQLLARYDRLCAAVSAASGINRTDAAAGDGDLHDVSWARAWKHLREMGFADKRGVEAALGRSIDRDDPREVVRQAKAARPATATPELPLSTIAGIKQMMNVIAKDEGLPVQYDANGSQLQRSWR